MIDPRSRQRVQTVTVKPTLDKALSNAALVEMWESAWGGDRMGRKVFSRYKRVVLDAIGYFRHPDGREIPAREWTKEGVWDYLQFVEKNYCAAFKTVTFDRPTPQGACDKGQWTGLMDAAEALQAKCAACPLFVRPGVEHRVNGLAHWFRHLSILGAIPFNIMLEVRDARKGQEVAAPAGERRRNPTPDEMKKLVNETAHPARRAFYAISAKCYYRPNEMMALDRYASFGLTMPKDVPLPPGFDTGFPSHPEVAPFDQGGDMVYVPRKVTPEGVELKDKRRGNRWMVVDAELRPIVEQLFAWWEANVARDEKGRPLTTKLWLNYRGFALEQDDLYYSFFYDDCLRLGLMTEADQKDPLRVWTAHCQRHFAERLSVELNFPDIWAHHFRGDKIGSARGKYYQPEPLAVRKAYHEWMPRLGFLPLAEAPKAREASEEEVHRMVLRSMLMRVTKRPGHAGESHVVHRLRVEGTEWIVPAKVLSSVLYALRKAGMVEPSVEKADGQAREYVPRAVLVALCERALGLLDAQSPAQGACVMVA